MPQLYRNKRVLSPSSINRQNCGSCTTPVPMYKATCCQLHGHCLQVCRENVGTVHARQVEWQDGRKCFSGLGAGQTPEACCPLTMTTGILWMFRCAVVQTSTRDTTARCDSLVGLRALSATWQQGMIEWRNVLLAQIYYGTCATVRIIKIGGTFVLKMWRRVALVRSDVSKESIASIFRVKIIS
jgi:hypothetical protein